MTKKELYEAMDGRISMVSIGKFEDEIQILGKYGMVSWMGDYWDVWITGLHHGIELSSRKVKHLAEAIGPLAKSIDTVFTGEAVAIEKWTPSLDSNWTSISVSLHKYICP